MIFCIYIFLTTKVTKKPLVLRIKKEVLLL